MLSPRRYPSRCSRSARLCLALATAITALPPVSAAVLTWDSADATNGSIIDPGSGTWNTLAGNLVWNNAGVNETWTQTSGTSALHSAVFGGTDGTYEINVDAAIAASALTFNNSGYTLSATAARTLTLTANPGNLTLAADKTATIGNNLTVISGNSGTILLNIAGAGTLNIGGTGARVRNTTNVLSLTSGPTVNVNTGGTLSTESQLVLGTSTSTTHLIVNGGTVSAGSVGSNTSSAQNIVLYNSTAAGGATLTVNSGSVTNLGVGRASNGESGLRLGPTATTNNAVNSTVNLNGGTLTVARVYEGNAGGGLNSTFIFNGGTLQVRTGAGNAANFLTGLDNVFVQEGGAIIDTNGVATTIAQALLHGGVAAIDGGLLKTGAGTLTLTGANTYTGATTVSNGTLSITAPYSGLSATTVNPGARLRIVSGTAPSLLPALTLDAGSALELHLGTYDPGRLACATTTTFNAAGDYFLHLTGDNVQTGSYTLFTYSGKNGAGLPQLGSFPPGVTALAEDTGSAVVLNVLTPQLPNFVWSAGSGAWDTTTANWNGQTYIEGALVTFPDLAGSHTVSLPSASAPFSVSLQNALGNTYTFTDSAIAGSASVTKTGTGAATFTVANTYSGPTAINAGALVVSADGALGTAAGATTISSGASLALSGGITYATAEKIVGSGAGTLTANVGPLVAVQRGMVQALAGSSTFAGPIEINATGTTRFGVQDGASLNLAGPITTATGVTGVTVLFRAGLEGDFITLSAPGNHWDGATILFAGTTTGTAGLRLGVDNGLPVISTITGGGTTPTNPLMTFDLAGYDQTLNGLAVSNGYLRIQNSSAEPSVLTLDLLTANATTARSDALPNFTTIHDGPGTGKVALVKKGAFRQTLTGAHTYTGPTTIEAGTLAFTGSGSLGATPVTLLAGSALDVAGITATDFALAAGLAGSGTLTATGKTVTISGPFAPGALAAAGNLTLSADTTTTLVAGAPEVASAVTVTGALTLNGNLTITKAPGFSFVSGQNLSFASAASIAPGLVGVTIDGSALTETAADVWTATIAGLDYTFTETTGTLAVSGGVVVSPLQAWRDTYFPEAGNDGTGIGAPDADPDGDGLPNLLEYATGTVPTTAGASGIVLGTADGKLTLTYSRADDPALVYTVQGRNDLAAGAWTPVNAANNPAGGGTTPITVQDDTALTAQPRRFLRLEVKLEP